MKMMNKLLNNLVNDGGFRICRFVGGLLLVGFGFMGGQN